MAVLNKILYISLTILTITGFAQKKTDKYNHLQLEVYLKAEEHYQGHEFYSALPLYIQLDSLTGRDEHSYEIGVCYFNTRHWKKAEEIFAPFLEHKYDYPASLEFYWAILNHFDHELEVAKFFYTSYLVRLSHSKLHYNEIVLDIQHRMSLCDIGIELMKSERSVDVYNLGSDLNTEYLDYAPIWVEDKGVIIFTSERPNTTGGEIDLQDGTYNEDVYFVYHPSNNVWLQPYKIKGTIDSESNESALAVSDAHDKLLIYKYSHEHFYNKGSGDIYEADYFTDSVANLVKLPRVINSKFWESGAAYYGDSSIILSSNRKGGVGGSDLYWVNKKDGEWQKPVNMGDVINSEFDEDSPYLTPDGNYLFFASKGHNTMGGFDLFYSMRNNDNVWSKPVNVGYPINTAHDEMYFSMNKEMTKMYLSSDRRGGHGDQDVYFVEMKEKKVFVIE